MISFRPIGYVIGLLVTALGLTMVIPLLADMFEGAATWSTFAFSAFFAIAFGISLILSCADSITRGLTIQQTFLLTTGCWLALPIFGAVPFWVAPEPMGVSYTDAFFEAMSGLTTTGSTIYVDIEGLSLGLKLWRGMLQWFGGIGIIVMAMAFLPMLKVGGMQIFRSEGFDTFGKILPRAAEIAGSVSSIYLALTVMALLAYSWAGLSFIDALVHAMTTVATGGYANYNDSFARVPAAAEYVAVVFMLLASLPFVRYVQLLSGTARPLFQDSQIRVFFSIVGITVAGIALWQAVNTPGDLEFAFRKALFNTVSILTGTGYASADYNTWGAFPVTTIFLIGLIGGCAGSTCCSIKVFRFQLLAAALVTQVRQLHNPHGVFTPRYENRPVPEDVISSVMAFFVLFVLTLAVVAILLGLMGLSTTTALSGAATALANIGPGLGPRIGPTETFASLPDAAKWVLAMTMLIGRLELLSVYVLFSVRFWRG
ncbi:MAG: TrkH family potassium uptake protein [Pseudomonadota bacterium]